MITPDEYNAFVIEWHSNHYPHQRFGQAFVNKFVDKENLLVMGQWERATALFYETSTTKAKELAWCDHVDKYGSTSAGS